MAKLYNLFMNLCLVILPAVKNIYSIEDEHGLSNYLDCFKSADGLDLLDGNRGKLEIHENNTSTSCIMYCRSLRYKYAGTKCIFCTCAESIKNDVETAICDSKCPGDENEFCGGKEGISLYNTGYTTEQEVTTTTTETTEIVTSTPSTTELSSIKNELKSESQITVTTEEAQGLSKKRVPTEKEQREDISTVTVVFIAVPSVIIVAVAFILVICLILRRRRLKRDCTIRYYTNGSEHSCNTSESATCKTLDDENLLGIHNDNKSSTSQHIEENAYSSADCGTEYGTVYTADTSTQAAHTYGCLKTQPGMNPTKFSEYSHMTVTKANPNPKFTDNTYAHIGNDKSLEHSTENDPERDSTYNTLQASLAKHVADTVSKSEGDQDALYDHATAGIGNQKRNNADEYAHLNSVKATVTTSQGNSKVNHVCEAIDSHETEVYDGAGHEYFILEAKK